MLLSDYVVRSLGTGNMRLVDDFMQCTSTSSVTCLPLCRTFMVSNTSFRYIIIALGTSMYSSISVPHTLPAYVVRFGGLKGAGYGNSTSRMCSTWRPRCYPSHVIARR
ncbi:hypothetical protein TRVL_06778 [Trypanosoma vivax]|nr:hypothetical protein TRVL_06778 [Trypanosoma vivax]